MSSPVATHWIDITPGFAGYLALPPAGRGPGLLLWPEIFGINPHIQAVAEQYALDGFVVLVPDVFWRDAPRVELGYEGADRDQALGLMRRYEEALARADINAALQALRARAEVQGKVGSLGYCMGGRLAYLTAATTNVDAAVAYYGGGIQNLLALAGDVHCPLQLHYAEIDDSIPLTAVQSVRQGLPQADLHLYNGARHGFNCWARAAYHAPSAALAHGRSLAFLAHTLAGA
jgi:carboxymethylenebutenolidase